MKEQGGAEKSGTRISTSVYQLRKRDEERREEILNTNFYQYVNHPQGGKSREKNTKTKNTNFYQCVVNRRHCKNLQNEFLAPEREKNSGQCAIWSYTF